MGAHRCPEEITLGYLAELYEIVMGACSGSPATIAGYYEEAEKSCCL
jgi:hypothetical protein